MLFVYQRLEGDSIEVLENKAEEILSVMSFDWKYEVLVNDVIEPMITLLKEQKEKIEELENSSS